VTDSTYALIIGSGVAGSLIARILVENGFGPVTMLEAGPNVPMRDPRLWLDFVTTGSLPYTQLGSGRMSNGTMRALLLRRARL
jgi:choline dehydrogenase-like flavoprotein